MNKEIYKKTAFLDEINSYPIDNKRARGAAIAIFLMIAGLAFYYAFLK